MNTNEEALAPAALSPLAFELDRLRQLLHSSREVHCNLSLRVASVSTLAPTPDDKAVCGADGSVSPFETEVSGLCDLVEQIIEEQTATLHRLRI